LDEDLTKIVDRSGFTMPVELQLDVYLQALLIFLGKATIYLKAMNKPLPQQIQELAVFGSEFARDPIAEPRRQRVHREP